MLAKGKAPKVLIASARKEPVADIPEGREAEMPSLRQKCPRYNARKGGLKGVELGSFRLGSQEKTADAVLGEAGAAAVET